jgi:hypothetical protein
MEERIGGGGETTRMTTRTRWSTKKKAKVLTVGTMVFLIAVMILLPHAFAYEDPAHCDGYSDCCSVGQTIGPNNADSDYWNHGKSDNSCPIDQPYSDAYCNCKKLIDFSKST